MKILKSKKILIILATCLVILITAIILYFNFRPKQNLDTTIEDLKVLNVNIENDGYLLTGQIENKGAKVGGVTLKATVLDDEKIVTVMHLVTYFNEDNIGNFNAGTSVVIKEKYKIEYEIVDFFD